MTNSQITTAFLSKISRQAKTDILRAVARHYNISTAESMEEITDAEAKHLLDYLTGSTRTATSVLMRRHGFS